MRLLALSPLVLAPFLVASQLPDDTPAEPGLHFEPGPPSELWRSVTPTTAADAELAGELVRLADPEQADPWSNPAVWARWAELVREVSRTERPDTPGAPDASARAHALLAELALAHGRWDDVWVHAAKLADAPALLAALGPHVAPGAPWSATGGAGGLPGPLPDGILLRPGLPPPNPERPLGWPDTRTVVVEGLKIGDALVGFELSLEGDGVQIDLTHRGGGPVTVAVEVPVPYARKLRVVHLDWERIEDEDGPIVEGPIEVTLSPDDEEPHVIWGRFSIEPPTWGERLPEAVTEQIARDGFRVRTTPDDPERAIVDAFAAALGTLFEAPAEVTTEPPPQGPDAREDAPLHIHLAPGPGRAAKLRALVSMAERFVLER